MQPALTHIQIDSRAADLRAGADRGRVAHSGLSGRVAAEARDLQATRRAPAFGALFLGHGFFGREHGSHA